MKQNKKKNNIGKVKAFINLRIEEDDKCTLNWKGDQKQQGKDMEEPDRNDRKEAKYVHD